MANLFAFTIYGVTQPPPLFRATVFASLQPSQAHNSLIRKTTWQPQKSIICFLPMIICWITSKTSSSPFVLLRLWVPWSVHQSSQRPWWKCKPSYRSITTKQAFPFWTRTSYDPQPPMQTLNFQRKDLVQYRSQTICSRMSPLPWIGLHPNCNSQSVFLSRNQAPSSQWRRRVSGFICRTWSSMF